MIPSLRLVVAMVGLAVLGPPFVYGAPGRNKGQEENLIARIKQEQNPGKKSRLQLRLAKMKLKEAEEAYHDRNFAEGKVLLQEYLDHVRECWATLEGSEGGTRKHLGAYKELEISLREEDRSLEDLGHHVPYPEDESIKTVAKEISVVHNQVLEAIFPAGLPPKERSKRTTPSRSWVPAKFWIVKT
ncbi:MAG TPA: hypothetical protein VNM47_11915 [Terriglobia bacterium]|nr:hypothetical protein [Terriglobia bacterium]